MNKPIPRNPRHLQSTALLVAAMAMIAALVHTPAAHANEAAAMGALKVAKHYYDKGEFKKAAERFHEAYGIHKNPAFMFNAARAEQRAFMLAEAERDFRIVLKTSKDKEMRRRTQIHLDEIKAYRTRLAKGQSDAEKAKADADRARKEAAAAKAEADQAKTAAERKGRQRVVSGVVGMTTKEKVLYGVSAGLFVFSAIAYGGAIVFNGEADTAATSAVNTPDPALRNNELAEHETLASKASGMQVLSISLFLVGGGVGWYTYAFGGPDDPEPTKKATWRFAPTIHRPGLVLSGSF